MKTTWDDAQDKKFSAAKKSWKENKIYVRVANVCQGQGSYVAHVLCTKSFVRCRTNEIFIFRRRPLYMTNKLNPWPHATNIIIDMITRCVLSQVINKKPNKEKCLLFKSNFIFKNLQMYKNSRITAQNTLGEPFYVKLRDFLTPCRAKDYGQRVECSRVFSVKPSDFYRIHYSTALFPLLLRVFSICYPNFRH